MMSRLSFLLVTVAALGTWAMGSLSAHAQAVTVLHTFGDGTVSGDGHVSFAGLVQGADGNFYGTTQNGGTAGAGCIFKCTPSGTVTIVHSFGDGSVANDGANPTAGLLLAGDGNFYGTTYAGGSTGSGCVFELTASGTYSILHRFSGLSSDAAGPKAGLIQGIDGNFYGTAMSGGSVAEGCIYEITHAGVVTILHNFSDGSVSNDGMDPVVGLVQDSQGNFYGTTFFGGANGYGTVYLLNAARHFSILYSFSTAATISFSNDSQILAGGSGGYYPNSRLLLGVNGNLYGTTFASSSAYGNGALYQITPQGQESVLYYFSYGAIVPTGQTLPPDTITEAPGENALIQAPDGNIYGTTGADGSASMGSFFRLSLEGRVTILHSFQDGTVANEGSVPAAGVTLGTDGNFYGTTSVGGSTGFGTIFKVVPQLPEITSSVTINGAIGVPVSYQTVATNSPISYSAANLPGGLSINASTGVISGTPTTLGITTNATLTVTNAAGSNTIPLTVIISPPPVITSILTAFPSEEYFLYQITASGNPTSYGATGLPPGLSVNTATGLISGAPTSTGTFSATITASNVAGSNSRMLKLVVSSVPPAPGQEYALVHSNQSGSITNEGSSPGALAVGSDGTLFGVTASGGANSAGTVFNITPAGDGKVLNALGGINGTTPLGVILGADGNYYGMTQNGGANSKGTIFKMTPAGVVTVLHTFGDGTVTNDGANPRAKLFQDTDGTFYGTTQNGGSANHGTVFKMTSGGTVTTLHSFGDGSISNDGLGPMCTLVKAPDNNFYGTTQNGGSSSGGTIFSMTSSGTVAIAHDFPNVSGQSDGTFPVTGLLVDSGGGLDGTTPTGGTAGKGVLFRMDLGDNERILHTFGDGSIANDGQNPQAPIATFDGFVYFGTTQNGGSAGKGTIFEYTNVGGFNNVTLVHSFGDGSVANDGIAPLTGLCVGKDGNFYGATSAGGSAGAGAIYAIAARFSDNQFEVFTSTYWTLTGNLPTGMNFDSTSGTISGTPLASDPPGAYTITISQVSNAGTTQNSQSVTITLTGVSTTKAFAAWEAQYLNATLLANTAISSPTATPKGDATPNLFKYVFNINPSLAMSATDRAALPSFGMQTIGNKDYLTLTYRKYALIGNVTINVQSSPDLFDWQTVTPDPAVSEQIGTDPNTGDPIMKVGVQMSDTSQFIRLNLVSP